jgi:ACS family hexuronate transporter-like MFS transporter
VRDLDHAPGTESKGNITELMGILRGGRFWAVALLLVGAQIVWQVYRVWLMKFLQTGRGYAEAEALNFQSLYYIATDAGCIAAGFVSIWLIRHRASSPHDARRTVYAAACVLTSLCVVLPKLEKGGLLLATLLLIGAGALALFPCYYSFTQELSPTHVGRLTGLLSLWVWAVTSPMHSLFGKLADHTKSYDLSLVIAGLVPWIGVITVATMWRRDKSPNPC